METSPLQQEAASQTLQISMVRQRSREDFLPKTSTSSKGGNPCATVLSKSAGVAETEVRDLVSEGKVGFPELEQAFNLMTDEGGKFNSMMEKISTSTLSKFNSMVDNAQLTLASFGDILLPMANDAIDAISGILEELQGFDDGSKRFIVTTGGVAAAIAAAIPNKELK